MPILRALVQQIEAHRLEEWEEGAIVARPLGLLHRCVEAVGGEADMRQDLYRRICKLDPVQAISFTAPVVHAGVSEAADVSA